MRAEDPETAADRIVALVKSRIPKRFGLDPMRDIQVLCPMNRGGVGARSLNIELQAALNPAGERKVERFGWTFAPGDKVMQNENDYDKEVYNGDIGHVADVDPEAGELTACFEGRQIVYGFGELDTLVPAYAATVHKSQGSEYPAVVIPVPGLDGADLAAGEGAVGLDHVTLVVEAPPEQVHEKGLCVAMEGPADPHGEVSPSSVVAMEVTLLAAPPPPPRFRLDPTFRGRSAGCWKPSNACD